MRRYVVFCDGIMCCVMLYYGMWWYAMLWCIMACCGIVMRCNVSCVLLWHVILCYVCYIMVYRAMRRN